MKEPTVLRVTSLHPSENLKVILVVDDANLFDKLRNEVYQREPRPLPVFLNIESRGEFACSPEIIDVNNVDGLVIAVSQRIEAAQAPFLEKGIEKKVPHICIATESVIHDPKIPIFGKTRSEIAKIADFLLT